MESGTAHEPGNPMRHHKHYVRHKRGGDSPYAGGSSFMESMSEKVASGMGTVGFLVVSTTIILGWVFIQPLITFLGTPGTGCSTATDSIPSRSSC